MSDVPDLADVDVVRYRWIDFANVVRAKGLYLPRSGPQPHAGSGPGAADSPTLATSVGISQAQYSLPVTVDAVVPETGLLPTHDLSLRPDFASLARLPYAPGNAAVACDILDRGEPWPLCPRTFLRRTADRTAAVGWDVRVGTELEFQLFRAQPWQESGELVAADSTAFAQESGFDAHAAFLADVLGALAAQQVLVHQLHPESGGGQFEISLRHLPPVAAADAVITARQTIHAVAAAHGLIVSFLPVLAPDGVGSGMHVHISVTGSGTDGLGEDRDAVVGGVLEHLPALLALTAPTPMSHVRFRPHYWAGAFRCWGYENKEAALRVTRSTDGVVRDVEYKAMDTTANPYLAFGGLLAAAIDGAERRLVPPPPFDGDPGLLSPAERDELGIAALPSSPAQPQAALAADEVLREAMGERLHRTYLALKAEESRQLEALAFDSRTRLLLQRY